MTLSDYLCQPDVTASALALKLGVSHTTVIRWAKGTIPPDMKRLQKLHEVTDGKVTPNDFLTGDAPRPTPAETVEAM